MNEMKLNNKRTILVGLAFLSICSFWQMYDNLVPLILKQTFQLDESLTGIIMAADNILALFLLPLFGALSDKTNTRLGSRTPYIIGKQRVLRIKILALYYLEQPKGNNLVDTSKTADMHFFLIFLFHVSVHMPLLPRAHPLSVPLCRQILIISRIFPDVFQSG